MFTLILQSILQDSNRWADVGKNLIDETPFVWPVLTNETAQDELCANCEEYSGLQIIFFTWKDIRSTKTPSWSDKTKLWSDATKIN